MDNWFLSWDCVRWIWISLVETTRMLTVQNKHYALIIIAVVILGILLMVKFLDYQSKQHLSLFIWTSLLILNLHVNWQRFMVVDGVLMLQVFGACQWHLRRLLSIFSSYSCYATPFHYASCLDFLFAWSGHNISLLISSCNKVLATY